MMKLFKSIEKNYLESERVNHLISQIDLLEERV